MAAVIGCHSRTRVRAWPAVAVLAVAAGALLAACAGGPSPPGVASLATGARPRSAKTTSYAHTPLGFALCMRGHGDKTFPEPSAGGGGFAIGVAKSSLDPQSESFGRAFQACRSLISPVFSPAQQAASEAQGLRFARCMRAHGVTNFPDPQVGGNGFVFRVHASAGLDKNNALFRAAAQACSGNGGVLRTTHRRT